MTSPDRSDLQRQKNYCELHRKLASKNSTRLTTNLIPESKLVPKPNTTFSAGSSSISTSIASLSQAQQNVALHVVKAIRWISAWDLWLYVLKSEMKPYVTEFLIRNGAHQESAKESLILELKSITSGVASCTSTQKDVRIMFYLIDIWEQVRREGISVLSALQITTCEHKSDLKRVRLDQLLKLELGQETIISKILYVTRTIDTLYEELEDLVDRHIDTKCLPFGIDQDISLAITKLRERDETAFALPPETIQKFLNSNKNKKAQPRGKVTNASPFYNLPDFFEPLFVGRQIPVDAAIVTCASRYDRIIEIAIEWFMAWCLFGESIFDELARISDAPRTFKGQRGFLDKQILHIQNISIEVKEINNGVNSWHVLMKSCLFVLEALTTLLEVTKHESSYLIHHLETCMIRNGVKDLKKMPGNPIGARLYCIRNVVLSKDRIITTSTEYLYREVSFLIELIESKFHNCKGYLNEFGSLTARLMSKYTNHRKEMMQNLGNTPGTSEPKDLNRQCSNTEDLDDQETNKSLGSVELEEASLALQPETLKHGLWVLSSAPEVQTDTPSTSTVEPTTASNTSDSFELVNLPLHSHNVKLQAEASTGHSRPESRAGTDSEGESPPSVFDIDSASEPEQSLSDQDLQAMPRSVPATSKSRLWNSLMRKFRSQKSERK